MDRQILQAVPIEAVIIIKTIINFFSISMFNIFSNEYHAEDNGWKKEN